MDTEVLESLLRQIDRGHCEKVIAIAAVHQLVAAERQAAALERIADHLDKLVSSGTDFAGYAAAWLRIEAQP